MKDTKATLPSRNFTGQHGVPLEFVLLLLLSDSIVILFRPEAMRCKMKIKNIFIKVRRQHLRTQNSVGLQNDLITLLMQKIEDPAAVSSYV